MNFRSLDKQNASKHQNRNVLAIAANKYILLPGLSFEIVETKRIGIDYSEEAKDFLWRFYIKNNNFISKK